MSKQTRAWSRFITETLYGGVPPIFCCPRCSCSEDIPDGAYQDPYRVYCMGCAWRGERIDACDFFEDEAATMPLLQHMADHYGHKLTISVFAGGAVFLNVGDQDEGPRFEGDSLIEVVSACAHEMSVFLSACEAQDQADRARG